MDMMAEAAPGWPRVIGPARGKDPPPCPVTAGIWIFDRQGVRQLHLDAGGQVPFVEQAHLLHPASKRGSEATWQQGDAVLSALAVAHRQLVAIEVDILDSQPNTFEETQT